MVNLENFAPRMEVLQLLSIDQAWHYRALPKALEGNRLVLYVDEEHWTKALEEELSILSGFSLAPHPAPKDSVSKALSRFYLKARKEHAVQSLDTSYAENFVELLIREAKSLGSSDIHIESYEQRSRIRFRIDGMLVERYVLKKQDYPSLINKIKIQAHLDIAEKRLPQDGRISFSYNQKTLDLRVSVLPTLYGEKVVLRILNNDATNVDIHQLGFGQQELADYLEGVRRPNGIILISGPTGSGKTTTLYATLKLLNKESRNIITIEDPIEYTLEGVNQVQLKEGIGFTFAAALRTFLRQDPDIIMVGEIRDSETANMAIRAALTGHLVLSTIHTNSAWGTISRLLDMGVPPFLVANTLNTTVAQRLVRLLCTHCKEEVEFDQALYPRQFRPFHTLVSHWLPKGCDHCYYTGYRGRKAIYEVIPLDSDLADKIKHNTHEIADLLKERQLRTLIENAFDLFESGHTSLEEIYPLLFQG